MTKFSGNNQEQIITLNDWALLSDQSKENFLKLSSGYDALQSALDIQNNNVTKLDNEIDRLDKELDTAQEENKKLLSALISMCDQYIQEKDGRLCHYFISAGEEATETLEDLGFLVCEEGENYRWTDKRQSALNGGK